MGKPPCAGEEADVHILNVPDPILWTDGSTVTETTADIRYKLLGDITQGNVSLTIRNVSKTDEGTYCCRVEIPGWFNDQTHEKSVKNT
ncbi:unnamed protein product [Staurois parvus]|uniref:Ig-like domain-containing protein n=1 Tax=Staurois parvus TaxID=386267 RepID=A0ABN9G0A3_9NEOB|nr:unnamed protein product [Staurois parvus]